MRARVTALINNPLLWKRNYYINVMLKMLIFYEFF
jgi:hypothetical protein